MKKTFTYLEDDSTAVVFNNNTLDFYRVFDSDLKKNLRKYFNDGTCPEEALNLLKSTIEENKAKPKEDNTTPVDEPRKRVLEKLTILTTNNCNLRCKYCYAEGGNYGQKVENLSCEEGKNIVDYFIGKFDHIKLVFFFGGEPLLNPEVIEYICNYFHELKNEGKIDYIPNFAVITNGTAITDDIINILIKYNFMLTISMDGEKLIHDYLRVDTLKNGTFDKLITQYNQLIKKGFSKDRIGFECTYTRAHIDQQISFVDLIKYYSTKFERNIVHIAPVCINSSSELSLTNYQAVIRKYTKELVDYTFDTILNEKIIKSCTFILSIIDRFIAKRQITHICPAGLDSLSIAKDSVIRPCFIFSGSNIEVGNLNSTYDELIENLTIFDSKYNQKHLYEDCKDCWARNVCSLCLRSYGDNLDEPDIHNGAESMCTIMNTMISDILLRLSRIKSNEEEWNTLIEVFQKYNVYNYEV